MKKLYAFIMAAVLFFPVASIAQRTQIQQTGSPVSAIDLNDL